MRQTDLSFLYSQGSIDWWYSVIVEQEPSAGTEAGTVEQGCQTDVVLQPDCQTEVVFRVGCQTQVVLRSPWFSSRTVLTVCIIYVLSLPSSACVSVCLCLLLPLCLDLLV